MRTFIILCLFLFSVKAFSQTPATSAAKPAATIAYGTPINLSEAKKIAAAAEAYAISKQYTIVIAIVDNGGNLVYLEKMDNTQLASIEVAMGKAKTSNNFKRPTKALEDAVAAGGKGVRVLALPAYPIEGGEIILSADGKIMGSIGVSGMSAEQDDEVAKAGLAGLK